MIEFVSGIIIEKKADYLILEANGIGYKIFISLNSFNSLPDLGTQFKINTFFHITENSQCLYGFNDIVEKELFLMLIGVSGIGPRTGISLLSAVKPLDFKQRIIAGEVKMLTSLPGIGPKTAKRIIIELKDKFVKDGIEELPLEDSEIQNNTDAFYALLSLGYKSNNVKSTINEILKLNPNISTEKLIKESLKKIR
tara:strand:+ start:898 stop:1485 length:588 start_codon:yes stop_codon:yes gene_type:complete